MCPLGSKVSSRLGRYIHSGIAQRMASGAIWSFTGTATAKFVVMLAGIFCANILGKEDFGKLGIIRSTINMFIVLGSVGLGVTSTKYISQYRNGAKEQIPYIYSLTNTFATASGMVVTLLILLSAHAIATGILKDPQLATPIRLGAVLLFFSIINGAQNGALMGFENFRGIAFGTLAGSICEAVFMTLGAYCYGVSGAILGFGIGFIVIYLCNRYFISQDFRHLGLLKTWHRIHRKDLGIIFSYSLPAALSALMIAPTFWLLRSMIVRHDGFGELAVFEAADQWKVMILFVPTAISQIALPILSSLTADGDKFRQTLRANCLLIGAVTAVAATLVCLLSNSIMSFYGRAFADNVPLVILSISTVFSAVANILEMSMYSLARMWTSFAFNVIWAAMTIVVSWLLLGQGMGARGIATAILVAYIFNCIFQFAYLNHMTGKLPAA